MKYLKKGEKGQGLIEYMLVVAAVIAAILLFAGPQSPFQKTYNSILQEQANYIDESANAIFHMF